MTARSKILYIHRGLPGSGKTTASNAIGCLVIDPDSWFVQKGQYIWDPAQHSLALRNAELLVEFGMKLGYDISLSETLPKLSMLEPFQKLAKKYEYEVFVRDFYITPEESIKRNVHDVVPENIYKFHREWEPWHG